MSRSAIREGLLWGTASKLLNMALGVLLTFLLAEFFTPDDFGIIAIAMVVIYGFQLLRDVGIPSSIITDQNHSQELINTGATLFHISSFLVLILTLIAAPHIAAFLNDLRLTLVLRVLALILIPSSLSMIHATLARKTLQFKKNYQPEIIAHITRNVLSIVLAVMGWGYWSVIAGVLVSTFLRTILLYIVIPTRVQWRIDRTCLRRLFSFSVYAFINTFLRFIVEQFDRILVGKLLRIEQVGYYFLAFKIACIPEEYFSPILTVVLLPYFSQLDTEHLRQQYVETTRYLRVLFIPIYFMIGLMMEPVFVWLYGNKWLLAVPLVHVFALFGVIWSLFGPLYIYTYARRKPAVMTLFLILQVGIAFGSIFAFRHDLDAAGIAMILTGTVFIMLLLWIGYLHRYEHIPLSHFLYRVWLPLSISAGAALFVKGALSLISAASPLMTLTVSGVLFPAIVGLFYWKLYRAEMRKLYRLLVQRSVPVS